MPDFDKELDYAEESTLNDTFEALSAVIAEEGNSVWSWYLTNSTAPLAVRERRVDRIVANPPSVRMSAIQVEGRKADFESLAKRLGRRRNSRGLGLWGQGKVNTSFDIAALFVSRCRENYLLTQPDADDKARPAAGWVLPWAAIRGENWETARRDQRVFTTEIWDLSKVKKQPFTGSKSCVWIQTAPNKQGIEPPTKILVNKPQRRVIRSSDSWSTAEEATEWKTNPDADPPMRSKYFVGARPMFAQGATLVPHCLVKVARPGEVVPDQYGWASFETAPSRHRPWKNLWMRLEKTETKEGKVPEHWIRDAAYASDLLVYATREQVSKVVLPLPNPVVLKADAKNKNKRKKAVPDNARAAVGFWSDAAEAYKKHRSKGASTPKTLWKRLDYHGALSRQLEDEEAAQKADQAKVKVLYNASGKHLRAARCRVQVIAEHKTYHAVFEDEDEACYITALLNADCLQPAYDRSHKSDRDLDQHFWRTAPIPRYDRSNDDHRELAELCRDAEKIAGNTLKGANPGWGQIKLSRQIRNSLKSHHVHGGEIKATNAPPPPENMPCVSVSDRIDGVVRRILPDYATAR